MRFFHVKRTIYSVIAGLAVLLSAQAQSIQTAEQFFGLVAEQYGQIIDYEGSLKIMIGKSEMLGTISYKSPSFLRVDFTQPADQVICFNGDTMVVYIPEFRAILSQQVAPGSGNGAAAANLASGEGLKLMRKNYTIAYETNPTPVALDLTNTEMVIRLVLSRRSVSEGFRTIKVSVNPETKMIRRLEGQTLAGDIVIFDFTAIKKNQNIPVTRFSYDTPAGANTYNNFLFKTED